MYKFFGEPLKEIKSKTSGKTMFRFDTKGEFITDDSAIINRAKGFFDYIEMEAETVGERVEKTYVVPPMTITTREDVKEEVEETPEIKTVECKKCGETFDNKGQFLAHARKCKKE